MTYNLSFLDDEGLIPCESCEGVFPINEFAFHQVYIYIVSNASINTMASTVSDDLQQTDAVSFHHERSLIYLHMYYHACVL